MKKFIIIILALLSLISAYAGFLSNGPLMLEYKPILLLIAFLSLTVSIFLKTLKQLKESDPEEKTELVEGLLLKNVTINNLLQELNQLKEKPEGTSDHFTQVSEEKISTARKHFTFAKKDYKEEQYYKAAQHYRRSIDAIPTMSGYLNLGTSLLRISQHKDAKSAYTSGLELSRKTKMYFLKGYL